MNRHYIIEGIEATVSGWGVQFTANVRRTSEVEVEVCRIGPCASVKELVQAVVDRFVR